MQIKDEEAGINNGVDEGNESGTRGGIVENEDTEVSGGIIKPKDLVKSEEVASGMSSGVVRNEESGIRSRKKRVVGLA